MLRRLDPRRLLSAGVRLGSGCRLQQFTGAAFELEPLCRCSATSGHARWRRRSRPTGSRSAGLLRSGGRPSEPATSAICRSGWPGTGRDRFRSVLDAGVLDRLRAPAWRCPPRIREGPGVTSSSQRSGAPLGVADADLGVLVRAPRRSRFAADVVEEEEPGAEGRIADLRVPHEEAAGERSCGLPSRRFGISMRRSSSARNTNMSRSLAKQRRVALVDGDPLAEDARHAPVSRDAVAEALDEGINHVGIPDAAVAGTGGGAEARHRRPDHRPGA